MRKTLLTLAAGLTFAGCTTGPGIQPMSGAPGVYFLVRESPTQFPPADKLAEESRTEAAAYCDAQGGDLDVLEAQASKGWNMTGNVPIFKMRFRCTLRTAAQAASATPR